MDIKEPVKKGFTIYSKSGCMNCSTLKRLLKNNNFLFVEINCDDYLIEFKKDFLNFIKNISKTDMKTFPIVFYDGNFIGGFSETSQFINEMIEKLLLSFEDNF